MRLAEQEKWRPAVESPPAPLMSKKLTCDVQGLAGSQSLFASSHGDERTISYSISPSTADYARRTQVLSQLPSLPRNDLWCTGIVVGFYSGFTDG